MESSPVLTIDRINAVKMAILPQSNLQIQCNPHENSKKKNSLKNLKGQFLASYGKT